MPDDVGTKKMRNEIRLNIYREELNDEENYGLSSKKAPGFNRGDELLPGFFYFPLDKFVDISYIVYKWNTNIQEIKYISLATT